MSTIIMSKCWPLPMSPTQKSVLISLADQANDHGVCWPSIDTISMRTCLSRRTVIDAIAALEAIGHLTPKRTVGQVTHYILHPCSSRPRADAAPVQELHHPRAGAAPDPCSSRTGPVQELHPNRKEPTRTVIETSKHVAERQDAGPVIRSTPAEPALDRSGKPVPSIPLKSGRDHVVQQSEFRQLCDLFPRIDVARELALARRWCEDNPARTKTAKGVGRFLVRWMTTAQNDSDMRARGTGHATGRALSAVERVQQAISRRRAERGESDQSDDWRGNVVATQ